MMLSPTGWVSHAGGRGAPADEHAGGRPHGHVLVTGRVVIADERHLADADGPSTGGSTTSSIWPRSPRSATATATAATATTASSPRARPNEALRALKRRVSDAIFIRLQTEDRQSARAASAGAREGRPGRLCRQRGRLTTRKRLIYCVHHGRRPDKDRRKGLLPGGLRPSPGRRAPSNSASRSWLPGSPRRPVSRAMTDRSPPWTDLSATHTIRDL